VHSVSAESGVTNCTADTKRDTYYKVEADFDHEKCPNPGNLGTNSPEIVQDVLECIAPAEEIEVALILANCPLDYGGRAFENLDLAILPRITDPSVSVNVAAHELAHVTANLGEEYISCCVPTDPTDIHSYLNIVTEEQRQNHDVWWRSLAYAAELDANGWFLAQHLSGPSYDPNWSNLLGLFWGAQYVDIWREPQVILGTRLVNIIPTDLPCDMTLVDQCIDDCLCEGCEPAGCCRECAPDACATCPTKECEQAHGYFRPMDECRMRFASSNFCRACAGAIADAIFASSQRLIDCEKGPCVTMKWPGSVCPAGRPVRVCPELREESGRPK